ncbi:MAG: 30S ribosomal protein S30e [Candidatus Bathyarchaeota archaeon]|nr:30S ribosomal protein S30e [Candidatus Bathyarchaeota archaeon]
MPTHGSLSKAGKVRSQTPKMETRERSRLNPRVRYRRAYEKRVILGRNVGQFRPNFRGRRRRRR